MPLSDAHLANFPSTFDVAMADGEILHMPTHALGWVASAYCITRALSWQLKVSPFSFPDLVAALSLQQPGPIVDDLHVAVLRCGGLHLVSMGSMDGMLTCVHVLWGATSCCWWCVECCSSDSRCVAGCWQWTSRQPCVSSGFWTFPCWTM